MLSIGPTQARHYELIYHPLTMTTDMQKHQGSIFFPLPDGTGLLYNLQGTAEPPKHTAAITQVHVSSVVCTCIHAPSIYPEMGILYIIITKNELHWNTTVQYGSKIVQSFNTSDILMGVQIY